MDCQWHSGARIEVLNLPVPASIPEPDHDEYRWRLAEFVDRCAMVLEDWNTRDPQWLGEFLWGWVDYERQLAYLCLEVEGFADLRLFVWVNDFAVAGLQTIHVLAVNEDGDAHLRGEGTWRLLQRRDDVIAQLTGREP
jgi:hypothetical protein